MREDDKTPQQLALESETRATLKLVLSEMEDLARLPPPVATEPYRYNDRRQRVMKKLWGLVHLAVKTGRDTEGKS